ncbi:Parvovirus coat protein VP1-like protein [Bacillus sp. 2205SS5-2]|uniref:Parvovirus coat protein VP1-like protein n=1 Tax=Bacillus sp. 2205SS5-2 TaxID=3109031 RepID=UPI0030067EC1
MSNRRRKKIGFCFPGYRWCGPGCSGPGPPTNTVDAACRAHDQCYDRYGPSRRCDIDFLKRLEKEINSNTTEGRQALLMYRFIKLQLFFSI